MLNLNKICGTLTLTNLGPAMATVVFSHFYKIPLVPKVTKCIFYNISSSLLMLSDQNFFWSDKSMFPLRKNIFLMGNQK